MYINQLDAALRKKLESVYLVTGDVPLLIQEARDKIRGAAKNRGFSQHELLQVEPGFDWETFTHFSQNRSLFSDKSVIDLRLPKFDDRATKTLLRYLESPPEDLCLIISIGKLTSAQQKTRVYKAISTAGVTLSIWPISLRELPQWIRTRLAAANINADNESIQLLAEFTEGHLLATQQAIEKLQLLYPGQPIGIKEMTDVINDNARFNVFDLSNAVLLGNAERVVRIMNNLRFEGIEPTLILWALSRELRTLISMLEQYERGIPMAQILQREWQNRKPLIQSAITRLNYRHLLHLLQSASKIDQIIKGFQTGECWSALTSLALAMAGQRVLSETT